MLWSDLFRLNRHSSVKMKEKLKLIKDFLLDILYPRYCLGCGAEGQYICENCQNFLGEASLICPVCGRGSFSGQRHPDCPSRYQLDGLISVWEYEGLMKKVIHQIKYHHLGDAVSEVVALSLKAMAKDPERFAAFFAFLAEKPLITFIPLTARKKRRRGFNQAEFIAREFGKMTDLAILPLLQKVKETKSQTELEKEGRQQNVKGVFALRKGVLKIPKNLILVDDVWTTGATMREAARLLKQVGARKIWGFTLARTV